MIQKDDIVNKWEETGLLSEIDNYSDQLKLATYFENAASLVLQKPEEHGPNSWMFLPIIRRIFLKHGSQIDIDVDRIFDDIDSKFEEFKKMPDIEEAKILKCFDLEAEFVAWYVENFGS